jgi:uncharacterized phage-like protein YoqJ
MMTNATGKERTMPFSDRAIETRTWAEAEVGHRRDQQDGLSPRVGAPTMTQQTQPERRTILAFTGHRPQRMGGFNPDNPTALWVRAQLAAAIGRAIRAGFRTFIAGGALGFDYRAAGTVLDQQQQLILALPFAGHDQRWNDQSRTELAALIQRTHAAGGEVHSISAPGYNPQKLTIRNHWMIDRAHAVIAGWDGGQQGGTWNAITYARNVQRPIFGINHMTRTAEWM